MTASGPPLCLESSVGPVPACLHALSYLLEQGAQQERSHYSDLQGIQARKVNDVPWR